MTLSDFKAKLNWRLILVHMAACWFIYYAFSILALLHDLHLVGPAPHRAGVALWVDLVGDIGILLAFALSLITSKFRHWYWVNSLLAFLLACLLCWFDFTWHYLKIIFLTPGDLFHTLLWQLITNGSIMLAIGLLLLFLNGVARFIDGRKQVDEA